MAFDRLPLPFSYEALEPHIGRATLHEHYDAHHANYVKQAKALAKDAGLEDKSLQEIILASVEKTEQRKLFNNAAQAWNHDFYWYSLQPPGDDAFPVSLEEAVTSRFGTRENFISKFAEQSSNVFGSGWAWLVWKTDGIDLVTTANGNTPAMKGAAPLLTLDVWEHAYYLDRQHDRGAYIDAFLKNIANWHLAGALLEFYRSESGRPASSSAINDTLIQRLTWPHLTKMQA